MNEYLVALKFMEYIKAEDEDEAIRVFSEKYDIKNKYLYADLVDEKENNEIDEIEISDIDVAF